MKRVSVSRWNPPPPGLPPNRVTSTIASQVIPVATAMATSDVTGNTHRVPDEHLGRRTSHEANERIIRLFLLGPK